MLPCFFYTHFCKMQDKNKTLKCPFCELNELAKSQGMDKTKHYFKCENYKFCDFKYHEYYQKKDNHTISKVANVVVNKHKNGKLEMCVYKKHFGVEMLKTSDETISRNWKWEGNMLTPKTKNATLGQLKDSMQSAARRALDNCKSMLENNTWNYFVTLTFSNVFVDRGNDDAVKNEWKRFREYWQKRIDKNVKILCLPERHESGELHFHCVIGSEKLLPIVYVSNESETWNYDGSSNKPQQEGRYLFPIFENGSWKRFANGDPAFALSFFDKGRNYTAVLSAEGNQDAVKNYVGKYITKAMQIGYGQKRYFATRNLERKTKYCVRLAEDDLPIYFDDFHLKVYKADDNLQVFRNYNIKEDDEK